MINFPKQLIHKILNKPEAGMGYQIADIVLRGGKIYKQVVIDSGFITRVRGLKGIPFNTDEIEDAIITNDKWDFDKE